VAIRLTPKARADRVHAVVADRDGPALKVTVTAPPEDGKANAALLALLADAWSLPRRSLSLRGTTTSRRKVVHVAGDPALLRIPLPGPEGKRS